MRLLFNFGSGIGELTIESEHSLNNGNWHQIDIHFNSQSVLLVLDQCAQSPAAKLDKCQNTTHIPLFSEVLNVNGPLQVGGIFQSARTIPANLLTYLGKSSLVGLAGCVRRLTQNGYVHDVAHGAVHSANTQIGCSSGRFMFIFIIILALPLFVSVIMNTLD